MNDKQALKMQIRALETEKKRHWKIFIGGLIAGGVVSGVVTSIFWANFIISNFG